MANWSCGSLIFQIVQCTEWENVLKCTIASSILFVCVRHKINFCAKIINWKCIYSRIALVLFGLGAYCKARKINHNIGALSKFVHIWHVRNVLLYLNIIIHTYAHTITKQVSKIHHELKCRHHVSSSTDTVKYHRFLLWWYSDLPLPYLHWLISMSSL